MSQSQICFQIQTIQEDSAKLLVAYSGEKAREIKDKEQEVLDAWRNLQISIEVILNYGDDLQWICVYFFKERILSVSLN